MPTPIPKLSLSLGQVLWALSLGMPPTQRMIDDVRYLRQLGIPFDEKKTNVGRGNRITYKFDDLIELGVALYGLRQGIKPKDITGLLISERKMLRALYRQALSEQPPQALNEEWVKSRGRIRVRKAKEIFLRLHDRYSESPGRVDILPLEETSDVSQLLMPVEIYPGEKARTLLPLTSLVLELVAWALAAPTTKTGPQ